MHNVFVLFVCLLVCLLACFVWGWAVSVLASGLLCFGTASRGGCAKAGAAKGATRRKPCVAKKSCVLALGAESHRCPFWLVCLKHRGRFLFHLPGPSIFPKGHLWAPGLPEQGVNGSGCDQKGGQKAIALLGLPCTSGTKLKRGRTCAII